tara:strand:- start:3836 stop:4795 length:960 start_codon:yes stop_codon:yes gene_type:complete
MSLGITQYKQISAINTTDLTATVSSNLPLDIINNIYFEVSIVTTNAGVAPAMDVNSILGCISDISIIRNGSSRLVSLQAADIVLMNYAATGSAVRSNIDNTAGGAFTSTVGFYIPFSNGGPLNNSSSSIRSQDSYLDLRQSSGTETASVQIQFATPTITNVTSFDSVNITMLAGTSTGIIGDVAVGISQFRYNTVTLTGTGNIQTNLPVGGNSLNQYTQILLIGRTAGGALADGLFTNVELSSLGFNYWNSSADLIDTVNNSNGITHTTGLHVLPLYSNNRLTSRLVGSRLSQLQLQLTSAVAANQVVTIVQRTIDFAV